MRVRFGSCQNAGPAVIRTLPQAVGGEGLDPEPGQGRLRAKGRAARRAARREAGPERLTEAPFRSGEGSSNETPRAERSGPPRRNRLAPLKRLNRTIAGVVPEPVLRLLARWWKK